MRKLVGLWMLTFLYPGAASAEVTDKEPSSTEFLLGALLVVGASIALAKMKWWSSLAILPFSGASAVAVMQEIHDPYVGLAIYDEAGSPYVLIAFGFSVVAVLVPICAAIFGRRATMHH